MDLFSGLNLGSKVGDFKNKVTSAMGGVKENTLTTADPTLSKMKEGVALVSNKQKEVTGVISNYKSEVVEQLDGVIGALSGGKLNTKDVTKAVRIGPDGLHIDENSVISSVSRSLGFNFNSKSQAMQQLTRGINSQFKSLTGLNLGNMVTTDGTTVRLTGNWRDKLSRETFKQVGKITGLEDFIDVSAQGAIYNAVFANAAKYGMSGSYANIYASYPNGFSVVRRDAVLEILSDLIERGDLISIEAMIALLDKEGKNVVLRRYPNFVQTLFSKFRFDYSVHPDDYDELLSKLQLLLTTLIGDEWYIKQTSFGPAYDLGVFSSVSPDMKILLSLWDDMTPLLATVGMFRDSTAVTELRLNFRNVAQFDR